MGRFALGEGNLKLGLAAGAVAALLPWISAAAATSSPNDYFFVQGDQWALSGAVASINAPQAWCVSTGAGITVADVDTGADFGHPDLAGKLIGGARFTSGNGNPAQPDGVGPQAVQDDFGHGTMTTGITVADTNNGTGIAAVAPGARALVVKVLDSTGRGHDNDVAAGIEWASENGARVINLSLGPDIPFTESISAASAIPGAIKDAFGRGAAIAIAAGNDGLFLSQYSLSTIQSYALVVGALAPDATVAGYSDGATIYAPGGTGNGDVHAQVVSTYLDASTGQNSYAYGSGTSFATPQVAGVLAQLMAKGYSNRDAENQIANTAAVRNGLPDLDAARALGASGTCGAAAAPAHTSSGGPAPNGAAGGGASDGGAATAPPALPSPSAPATPSGGPARSAGGANALTPAPSTPSPGSPVGLGVGLGAATLAVAGAAALRARLINRPR